MQRPASRLVTAMAPLMRAWRRLGFRHGTGRGSRTAYETAASAPPDDPHYSAPNLDHQGADAATTTAFANEGLCL